VKRAEPVLGWSRLLFGIVAHAFASVLVVVTCVALTGLAYIVLLVVAGFTNGDIGGPLALPFMMLLGAVAGIGLVVLVLVPVTLASSWICRVVLDWPRLVQLPIALGLCLAETLAIAAIIATASGSPFRRSIEVGAIVAIAIWIPLACYWSVLQIFELTRWASVRVWRLMFTSEDDEKGPIPAD
jgi:hypothetical protein